MAQEDVGRHVVLDQVLAEEDGAAGSRRRRRRSGRRRRPGRSGATPAASRARCRTAPGGRSRRPRSRVVRRTPVGPSTTGTARCTPTSRWSSRSASTGPSRGAAESTCGAGVAGRAEDAPAAVEADAHAAVEGRDPAIGLAVAQVGEAGRRRGRARRQIESVDGGRGQAEPGAVRAHPVDRDVLAVAAGGPRQGPVDGLDAPRVVGRRASRSRAPVRGRARARPRQEPARITARRPAHRPENASLVCPLRPRDRQG